MVCHHNKQTYHLAGNSRPFISASSGHQALIEMIYDGILAEFRPATLQTLQQMKMILRFAPEQLACDSACQPAASRSCTTVGAIKQRRTQRMPIAPTIAIRYIYGGMSLVNSNKTWHELLDDRSLEMDRVIAEKIRANPKLVQIALSNIKRWLANPDYSESNRQAILEWKRIIETTTVAALLALLESSSEEARRLRQSSPFCGILTPGERQAIFRKYETHRGRAHLASR